MTLLDPEHTIQASRGDGKSRCVSANLDRAQRLVCVSLLGLPVPESRIFSFLLRRIWSTP